MQPADIAEIIFTRQQMQHQNDHFFQNADSHIIFLQTTDAFSLSPKVEIL